MIVRRVHANKLLSWCAFLIPTACSSAAVMSFGDNQAFLVSPYTENGHTITASTPAHAILDSAGSNFSSPYFTFQAIITTATITLAGGGSFNLQSLDVALGELAMGTSTDLTFVGALVSGETLMTTIENVTEVQTIVLNWTGLESVTVSATDDPGLDNIVFVPEPSSHLFLALATFGFAIRRKRNRFV